MMLVNYSKHVQRLFMKPVRANIVFSAVLAAMLLVAGCNKVAEAPSALPEKAKPFGTLPSPMSPAAIGNVSDVDVTEHVKTALQQSDLLKAFDITVVTLKGDVRLIGVLSSQAQIDEANRLARVADGVHAVHDELTIKK
jgi:hypothetical protein